jgi:hypothetical protein
MKYSVWLMTISAMLIGVITPTAARADGLGTQVIISPGGYSSTTIYEPYGTTTTTTTTDQSIVIGNPIGNPIGSPIGNSTSITTYSNNGGFYYINRPRRQYNRYRQPSVVFQQNNIYPYSGQSACTTTIIGSPIPSPIPLNRSTGFPCR